MEGAFYLVSRATRGHGQHESERGLHGQGREEHVGAVVFASGGHLVKLLIQVGGELEQGSLYDHLIGLGTAQRWYSSSQRRA